MKKVIEKGKEIMRISVDEQHDFDHIVEVEKISIAVFKELTEKKYPGTENLTEDLVRATAWWHDCYKARTEEFSLNTLFNEGKESRNIIEEELTDMLSKDDMELLADAVEHHAGWSLLPYFFLNRPRSALHKILIEADAYDLVNCDRAREFTEKDLSFVNKLWVFVDIFFESVSLPLYLRTDTTRKDMWKRLKKYWGMWLWDEWLLFKLFFPSRT